MRLLTALALLALAASAAAGPLPIGGGGGGPTFSIGYEASLAVVTPLLHTKPLFDPMSTIGSPAIRFVGSGAGVAEVSLTATSGPLSALRLAGGTFALGGYSQHITDTGAFPLAGISLSAGNGPASFGPSGGVMPLSGLLRVCLYATCDAGPPGNLSIPLSLVGSGGTATFTGLISATVLGAPWTTASSFTTQNLAFGPVNTIAGFAHGPGSATSTAVRASGALQLVTPIFLSTNIGAVLELGYGVLSLHFVPEPAVLLLLGGAAVLIGCMRLSV